MLRRWCVMLPLQAAIYANAAVHSRSHIFCFQFLPAAHRLRTASQHTTYRDTQTENEVEWAERQKLYGRVPVSSGKARTTIHQTWNNKNNNFG